MEPSTGKGSAVPESRRRRKQAYTPPSESGSTQSDKRLPVRIGGSRWVAPLMVAMFLIGLAWIVIWYLAPDNPLMSPLAGWNVAIGFVFIGIGFLLSTKWE
jgi:hypothetical protein